MAERAHPGASAEWAHPGASGVGSWPGTDARRAVGQVRELLARDGGVPYVPELPARGPGADIIGRTAAILTDLPVDLQPSGWRFTDAPGRDMARAHSFWQQDFDEVAEAYDGYTGPLKLQFCGPWTLAASVRLNRGERALSDPGACRDIAQALGHAAAERLNRLQGLVPGAAIVAQFDEPSLTAVLTGVLTTSSGFGRLRPIDPAVARENLTMLVNPVGAVTDSVILHSCADRVPLPLVRQIPDIAVSLDLSQLAPRQLDGLAELAESGRSLWLGALPTADAADPRRAADAVIQLWDQVGLDPQLLQQVTITPACGLADASESRAVDIQRGCMSTAEAVAEAESRLS